MTDNEIIKALECCKSKGGTCNGCAFGGYQGCIGALMRKMELFGFLNLLLAIL